MESVVAVVRRAGATRQRSLVLAGLALVLGALLYVWRGGGSGSGRRGGSGSSKALARRSSKGSSSRRRSPESTEAPKPRADRPDFIMLMGIPGSGKSTWAKQYVFKCDASFHIVRSDEVRKQLTGSVSDQSRNTEVWDVVLNQVQGALKDGRNVILDATNTKTNLRRQFFRQLPPCNRYLKVLQINKTIAKTRIARDIQEGVERAAVPDHIIDQMHADFHESTMLVKEEGWMMK